MIMRVRILSIAVLASAIFVLAPPVLQAQEAFTATASMKSEAGGATAPVRITIDRLSTEAERTAVVEALKGGGSAAVKTALAGAKDIGMLEAGGHKTPIRYAWSRPTGSGRIVTVATSEPIVHLGAGLPNAKPKAGYDFAVALLVLDGAGSGHGEFAPAAQLKVDGGAVVLGDYGADKVWLKNVAKAK
jgi:hypothetical protein